MKKKILKLLKIIFFLLLLICSLSYLGRAYNSGVLSEGGENKIFNQKENSFDILYFGNCHAYSTFMPSVIEEKTGLKGYMVGAADLNGIDAVDYLEIVLKKQNPSYLVIETFPFIIYQSYLSEKSITAYSHSLIAEFPFIERLKILKKRGLEYSDIMMMFYYHNNWVNNGKFNCNYRTAKDNGWVDFIYGDPIEDENFMIEVPHPNKASEIDEKYLESFNIIIEEAKKRNINVIVTTIPYLDMSELEAERLLTLKNISEQNGIPYLDFCDSQIIKSLNLDISIMKDVDHVNQKGAEIISNYFADYVMENYLSKK